MAPTPEPSTSSQSQIISQPGVIKSIHLTNFMCHSNFTHDFHSNLNFITGQNGSGKSAVLSGILVALGGKATTTSRSTSLKSLIQKGKNTMRVAVTLLNENGMEGYGDEITIERWLNVSGSGGYRIKFGGGEGPTSQVSWRPLKKSELDRILLFMNIQIDNPVAILNQEVARSFLRSKDPKMKFKLFYDGTTLTKLDEMVEEIQEELNGTEQILAIQRTVMYGLKDELGELKKRRNKIAELDKIKMKFRSLRIERLWALVIEQEASVKATSNAIAQMNKDLEAIQKRLAESREKLDDLNEESIVREQAEVRRQVTEKKRELDSLKISLNDTKRKFNCLNAKLKTIVNDITTKEGQIKKLRMHLDRRKAEVAAKAKAKTNEDQEKLDQLGDRKKHLESVCSSIKMDVDNFQQAAEQEREKVRHVEGTERQLKVKIESTKREILTLNSNASNKYAVFGPDIQKFVAQIEASIHKFRKRPRGPLGACFSVKDPQYVALIEGILWNHLHTFVVDNARDLQTLKEIMGTVYNGRDRGSRPVVKTPTIVKMDFAEQMYDISRFTASHSSAPTLLELIEVENRDHVVANALIEIAEVEKVLLFKNNASACQLLKDQSKCPRTLKSGYTLEWYTIFPAPRYGARVMKPRARAVILKSGRSRASAVSSLRSEIVALQQKLKDVVSERTGLQEEENRLRSAYEDKQSEYGTVKRELMGIVTEIKRHTELMKQQQKQGDLNCFYEELDELKEEKDKATTERETTTEELHELQPKIVEGDEKRKLLDKEFEELNTKLAQFEETRDHLNSRKAEVDNIIRKLQDKMTATESKKTDFTKELETKEKDLTNKKSNAEQCGKRVETVKKSTDLLEEFNGLKEHIKETEAHLGDIEDIHRQLADKQKKYDDYKRGYQPIRDLQDTLRSVASHQAASLEANKSQMSRILTIFFSTMVKQRGYEGSLLVDHKTRELHYFVCPDGDSASKTVLAMNEQMGNLQDQSRELSPEEVKRSRKLKKALIEYSLGLSGGERSYATICFIMALWQVMECPFYMLDEFDVFMDAFNRKTSQEALMAHARNSKSHQFVMFSPLDLSKVPDENEACVLRLFPPVRSRNMPAVPPDGNSNRPTAPPDDSSPQGPNVGAPRPPQGTKRPHTAKRSNLPKRARHNAEVPNAKFDLNEFVERLLNPPVQKKRVCITEDEVTRLCCLARASFLQQPTLIKIKAPVKICGDVHGQYFDLVRLFNHGGSPTKTSYLFLGDYVDRGKNSLETICLLLALKSRFPKTFFLVRGNHECAPINRVFGFFAEIKRRFKSPNFMKVYRKLNHAFNYMPIAAVIDNKAFCCHGGLSPSLTSLKCLTNIKRPIVLKKSGLVSDILWSDPDDTLEDWEMQNEPETNPKHRGLGYLWGCRAHADFLRKTKLQMVIRAHECVDGGYRWGFNKQLVTVFSAPDYSDRNRAAIGLFRKDGSLTFETFFNDKIAG